jgi:hypothetical protein
MNKTGKISAKKLVLSRETLKTLAPGDLSDVRGGLFFHTLACIIVTAPETLDGPECRPW